jgi:predicted PurR-regulated permease PerM
VGAGVGVMVWNMVLTGSVDNLVRPLFMRGRMRLHPLVVFLALIGGVTAFGVVGLLIGPLAAALFLAGVRIYDRDYRARLDPEGA